MKDELNRRDLLKGIGAAATASLAGCTTERAKEIRNQANRTQQNLKRELNWNNYELDYNVDSINVDTERLESTGVEDAFQYRINMKVALSDTSDDLAGWMATSERRAEFFNLLNKTTYDMLNQATDDFSDYEPSNQPSHRNQVVEYEIRVDAESCSYLEDTVPVGRTDNLLSSRSAYAEYVNNGTDYEINIEEGLLGLDLFC